MKFGVASENKSDPYSCGVSVAEKALQNCGAQSADFVFAVCNGKHDHKKFFNGLRSVFGDNVPITGGSALGVITDDYLSYEDFPAGAFIIESETLRYELQSSGGLGDDEEKTGSDLAGKGDWDVDKPLFLFYDSMKRAATSAGPPVINSSVPLLSGIESVLKCNPVIFGAGFVGDYGFETSKVFTGNDVATQHAVAFQFHDSFRCQSIIMHGCMPLDGVYHTITKASGPVIYEVDGIPIGEIIDDIYGHRLWRNDAPVQLVSLGINHGERYELPEEKNYINRLIMSAVPDTDAIVLFEPDLKTGDEFQFMLRDSEEMVRSVRINTEAFIREIKSAGKKIHLGFYFDCAGRTKVMSKTENEEAAELQAICKRENIPLFGFYTGVEIAPLLSKSRGLDWTGVLILFVEG